MPRTSYSLPFRPKEIIEGRQHPREGDLDRSITAFLSLLLRTAPGEVPGDPDFGCRFWDRIAEAMKGEIWLSQMSDDVRTAVKATSADYRMSPSTSPLPAQIVRT